MLTRHYDPKRRESDLEKYWQEQGIYHFSEELEAPVFSIDTPPPTVSGNLHLGHVYSYSHTDFIARFWRMRGQNVFYPMGFDDNGLPTERLVEKRQNVSATDIGRSKFIERCLQVSAEAEKEYEALWKRLGLSIDWRYTYRTIDDLARKTSQLSFIDLHRKGLVYHQEAPAIWCPECQTSIAQAELNDLERESEFVNLDFRLSNGKALAIATTRPELLPACVAVFVNPHDARYMHLIGETAQVPMFDRRVPIIGDAGADPQKGTGAVMCCTFGDTADISWWRTYRLPLAQIVERDGRLGDGAGEFAGLTLGDARQAIKAQLDRKGLILGRQPTLQSIRVHERCDTPVEYIMVGQWFVRVLDFKQQLLDSGAQLKWHPTQMQARYRAWVENLNWDWCISRQRYFGVPFPLWFCVGCGSVILAEESQLPVDPADQAPPGPCTHCGSSQYLAEMDVMDTWATSSMSPQIVGGWLKKDSDLYAKINPFTMRPQAHEIIRTWAFYTITKSFHHFGQLPWKNVVISGWGIAGEGMGKISKSRGGGPMSPMEMIERYSADAVRYWAASTGPGKDSVISEEKIQNGAALVNKLWNVARFCERFLIDYTPQADSSPLEFTPADLWLLSELQRLIQRTTDLFEHYDYAAAKSETEQFFWRDLADNYIEMAKQRLYGEASLQRQGAVHTLYLVLQTILKLFAPFLPYITEEIYQGLFARGQGVKSIHLSSWPEAQLELVNQAADDLGELIVDLATEVRRYKSQHNLSLGADIESLVIGVRHVAYLDGLQAAIPDLKSITRAKQILIRPLTEPEQAGENRKAIALFDADS